jgi:hypothetical protein
MLVSPNKQATTTPKISATIGSISPAVLVSARGRIRRQPRCDGLLPARPRLERPDQGSRRPLHRQQVAQRVYPDSHRGCREVAAKGKLSAPQAGRVPGAYQRDRPAAVRAGRFGGSRYLSAQSLWGAVRT